MRGEKGGRQSGKENGKDYSVTGKGIGKEIESMSDQLATENDLVSAIDGCRCLLKERGRGLRKEQEWMQGRGVMILAEVIGNVKDEKETL